ncbi:MAG: hypothetical protein H6Q37_1029 [Chloroflexi bacterium]|nr:hypothetical protein [Chloroflexota bacterium]
MHGVNRSNNGQSDGRSIFALVESAEPAVLSDQESNQLSALRRFMGACQA